MPVSDRPGTGGRTASRRPDRSEKAAWYRLATDATRCGLLDRPPLGDGIRQDRPTGVFDLGSRGEATGEPGRRDCRIRRASSARCRAVVSPSMSGIQPEDDLPNRHTTAQFRPGSRSRASRSSTVSPSGPTPSSGSSRPSRHVVHPAVHPRLLQTDQITRLLHHQTPPTRLARRSLQIGTGIDVRQIPAHRAVLHRVLHLRDGTGETERVLPAALQHEERQALGAPTADARAAGRIPRSDSKRFPDRRPWAEPLDFLKHRGDAAGAGTLRETQSRPRRFRRRWKRPDPARRPRALRWSPIIVLSPLQRGVDGVR